MAFRQFKEAYDAYSATKRRGAPPLTFQEILFGAEEASAIPTRHAIKVDQPDYDIVSAVCKLFLANTITKDAFDRFLHHPTTKQVLADQFLQIKRRILGSFSRTRREAPDIQAVMASLTTANTLPSSVEVTAADLFEACKQCVLGEKPIADTYALLISEDAKEIFSDHGSRECMADSLSIWAKKESSLSQYQREQITQLCKFVDPETESPSEAVEAPAEKRAPITVMGQNILDEGHCLNVVPVMRLIERTDLSSIFASQIETAIIEAHPATSRLTTRFRGCTSLSIADPTLDQIALHNSYRGILKAILAKEDCNPFMPVLQKEASSSSSSSAESYRELSVIEWINENSPTRDKSELLKLYGEARDRYAKRQLGFDTITIPSSSSSTSTSTPERRVEAPAKSVPFQESCRLSFKKGDLTKPLEGVTSQPTHLMLAYTSFPGGSTPRWGGGTGTNGVINTKYSEVPGIVSPALASSAKWDAGKGDSALMAYPIAAESQVPVTLVPFQAPNLRSKIATNSDHLTSAIESLIDTYLVFLMAVQQKAESMPGGTTLKVVTPLASSGIFAMHKTPQSKDDENFQYTAALSYACFQKALQLMPPSKGGAHIDVVVLEWEQKTANHVTGHKEDLSSAMPSITAYTLNESKKATLQEKIRFFSTQDLLAQFDKIPSDKKQVFLTQQAQHWLAVIKDEDHPIAKCLLNNIVRLAAGNGDQIAKAKDLLNVLFPSGDSVHQPLAETQLKSNDSLNKIIDRHTGPFSFFASGPTTTRQDFDKVCGSAGCPPEAKSRGPEPDSGPAAGGGGGK